MGLLLETVCIRSGQAQHLAYHQARMERSTQACFGRPAPAILSQLLTPPPHTETLRCRILYGETIEKIEYLPYTPRPIQRLKLVETTLEYPFKYVNRDAIEHLKATHPDADDIIMVKEGLLTDTTIANIAFFKEGRWYTPHQPLLEGTTRARLIDEGVLIPAPITKADLPSYSHVALMNAMIGFERLNSVTIE